MMIKYIKNPINALNITQFLSAFADSSIIIIIAMMLKNSLESNNPHDPYIFIVETFFLFAYVIFAPVVGTFADRNPKSKVLFTGNSIKVIGILLLIFGMDPAFSYGIIGIGAAVYGPAKYGILKELTKDNAGLLDANGKLEGFTILAIIIGTVVGGILSGFGNVGNIICLFIYLLSITLALHIPAEKGNKKLSYKKEAIEFFYDVKTAFKNEKINFTLTGSASFWMISVVIKNALLLWIPIHLGIQGGFPLSVIVGMTAIGIVIGSLLAKRYTSIEKFYRANIFGFIAASFAIVFPFISGDNLVSRAIVCILLLGLGTFAGMFIIPLNATLQNEAHDLLGPGKTIAVQNFVNNLSMLTGTFTVYLLNTKYGFSVTASLVTFGFIYLAFMIYLTFLARKFRNKNRGNQVPLSKPRD